MFAHGERHESAGSGNSGHPDLEEIAALIDGRLPEAKAARLCQHLGECEECREVFLEAVDFVRNEEALGQDADPLPFEPAAVRQARPFHRLLDLVAWPLAAALAVAIGLTTYSSQAPPAMAAVGELLAKDLARPEFQASVDDALHPTSVPRGPHDRPVKSPSFGLGKAVVALRLSAEAQNYDEFDAAATQINQLNDQFGLVLDPDAKAFFGELRVKISRGKDLRPFAETAERIVDHNYKSVTIPLHVEFGRWTEAGYLAAAAHDATFLQRSAMRRFPAYLRNDAPSSIDPDALEAVKAIQTTLRQPELGPADLEALKASFGKILKIYR